MANSIKDVDEKLSDDVIITKILGSFSFKYSNFVSIRDSVDYKKKTIDTLQEGLIKEKERLSDRDEQEDMVIVASSKQKNSSPQQKHQHKGQYNNRNTSSPIICGICGEPNHIEKYC